MPRSAPRLRAASSFCDLPATAITRSAPARRAQLQQQRPDAAGRGRDQHRPAPRRQRRTRCSAVQARHQQRHGMLEGQAVGQRFTAEAASTARYSA